MSCQYNLYLDVDDDGKIREAFPDAEIDDLEETCALRVARSQEATRQHSDERDGISLERIGELTGQSRESVRLIEISALAKLRDNPAARAQFAGLANRGEDDEE